MGEFDERVVVVTGGGIGLGKAFSRGFAAAGAQVVVADIAEEEAKTIAEEIGGLAVRVPWPRPLMRSMDVLTF
jgi:NAD(P)-dependent dehydrogenase (short-subunit alcohol dehydrogenase family)